VEFLKLTHQFLKGWC